MDGETLLTLSLAKLYGHHANFAGTPRQAIADGYSAVDAVFTALLRHAGLKQPKNHKQKLELVRQHFPNVFNAFVVETETSQTHSPGTDWNSLEAFYGEWLQSRYSSFEMGAAVASGRVREALNVVKAAIRHIAREEGLSSDDLETRVATKAYGFDFSEVAVTVGDAHDRLFAEAEAAGEEYGSRLGTKMAAATNYCDLDIMAGDELTQSIIRDDMDIANEAAHVYHAFVNLIERIQFKRLETISSGKQLEKCSLAEINKSPDFMLSMKARYHGGTPIEMGARIFGRISEAMSKMLTKLLPD